MITSTITLSLKRIMDDSLRNSETFVNWASSLIHKEGCSYVLVAVCLVTVHNCILDVCHKEKDNSRFPVRFVNSH
jgi:hypothetical protein